MNLGPRLRLPSFVVAGILVFILAVTFGPTIITHLPHAHGQGTAPYQDDGLFVVANNFSENGTNVPRPLVAGHWGWMLNFTRPANATLTFYEDWGLANQTRDFSASVRLISPAVVYLDLGSSALSEPIYLDVSWVG